MPQAQHAQRPAGAGGFKILAFPKEFERNIWESLDRRFYVILLISLGIIYGMVIYLANSQYSKEVIDSKIKQKYLQRFYEAQIIPEATVNTELESGAGIGEEPAAEEEQQADERAERDKGKRTEERGQSAAERAERRRRAAAARRGQRAAMEQAIAGTGVLGVLSAGGGGGTGDAVYDVLGEAGGGGVGNLDEVLSGVSGIQNASSASRRSQLGARSGAGTSGTAGIDDLIEGGAGPTGSVNVSRQGDFSIKFTEGSVTGKASRASGRSVDAIGRVVNSHADAIENCYKREARLNPNLQGSLNVQFTIKPNGRVAVVRILNSTLRNRKVESCVKRRIGSWRFQPIDAKEGNATFRQKFIFRS